MNAPTLACMSIGKSRTSTSLEQDTYRISHTLDAGLHKFDRSSFSQVKSSGLSEKYELGEELGSGSFGVVRKARDVHNEQHVAIKTIARKTVNDPDKIMQEFKVIRKLDHPHICKAYECYPDVQNIYFVMELLTGGTLLDTLSRQKKLTEGDANGIMRQLLSALAYLHEANFIFRDLKTENVMFSTAMTRTVGEPDEQGVQMSKRTYRLREIKLIDFGLCCRFEKGSKLRKAAGTPYTAAPELFTTPIQYDQKCDAWSAGVVMYMMMAGEYPFAGSSKDKLLYNIRKQPYSLSHPVWNRISQEAKSLLAELLRKDAQQRIAISYALAHPWVSKKGSLPDKGIIVEVVENFFFFKSLNMFQKAAITALAWRVPDEETVHLRDIFETLDRDGNGHITVQELQGVIVDAGVSTPAELQVLFAQADTDGGGTLEYTEFLAVMLDKEKVIKEDVIWEAFRIFDQDGSGTITKKELLKILTGRTCDRIKHGHGNQAVENFVEEYDVSGDAEIDFDEFVEMLNTVKASYQLRGRRASSGELPSAGVASSPVQPDVHLPTAKARRRTQPLATSCGCASRVPSEQSVLANGLWVSNCPCSL